MCPVLVMGIVELTFELSRDAGSKNSEASERDGEIADHNPKIFC